MPIQFSRADRRLFLQSIIAFLLTALLFYLPLPLILYFYVYRSDLDRLATNVPAYCVDYPIDIWVGPFHFDAVGRYPNSIQLKVDACTWPDGQPRNWARQQPVFVLNTDPQNRDARFEGWHLIGEWYFGKH